MLTLKDLTALAAEERLQGMFDVDNETYHAGPGIGSTGLKKFLTKTPRHYEYELTHKKAQTPAMKKGTMIHEAILQPLVFEQCYTTAAAIGLDEADFRKNSYKYAVAEHERSTGQQVIDTETMDEIKAIIAAVYAHPRAAHLLKNKQAEKALYWHDPTTGVLCKCKPDVLHDVGLIADLKSTSDADETSFARTIANLHYHVSAAFYLHGFSQLTGRTQDRFVWIAVETSAPYCVACYTPDFGTLEKGEELVKTALTRYKLAHDTGKFIGYSDDIQSIAIPGWAF